MTANIWLSYFNWIDAASATITADDEAGDLVVENLRERQGYKAWRTDGLTAMDATAGFNVDFGHTRSVACLALLFPRNNDPNAYDVALPIDPVSDTIRHRLSNVSAGAGEAYDSGTVASGVLDGYGYHVIRLPAAANARYWRCDLNAPSRADLGFLDVSRAWAGPVWAPAIGFSFGESYGWQSDSTVSQASRGIAEFIDSVPSKRAWSLQLDGVTNAEREDLLEFERRMTTAGQFLVARSDVAQGKGEMFARQAQSLGLSSLSFARNTKAFRLVESI